MLNLSFWDGVVLAIAAYVAIMMLVRLMVARRDEVVAQYKARIELEKAHKRAREQRQRRQQARIRQLEAIQAAQSRLDDKGESGASDVPSATQVS